ncbi:hypothetical protein pb186bvf_020376 [Paramecium bursaria]
MINVLKLIPNISNLITKKVFQKIDIAKIFQNNLLDYQKSLNEFDLCIGIDRQHFDAYFYKAHLLHNQFKKYEEAWRSVFNQIQFILIPIIRKHCQFNENLYLYEDSIDVLDQCIKLNRSNFDSHFIKGNKNFYKKHKFIHRNFKNTKKLLKHIKNVSYLKSKHFDSNYLQALILSQKLLKFNKLVQALRMFENRSITFLSAIINQVKIYYKLYKIWKSVQLNLNKGIFKDQKIYKFNV